MTKHVYLKPLPTAVNDAEAISLSSVLVERFDKLREKIVSHGVDCIDLLPIQEVLDDLHLKLSNLAESDSVLYDNHCRARILGDSSLAAAFVLSSFKRFPQLLTSVDLTPRSRRKRL
jgi:hypothetical protein